MVNGKEVEGEVEHLHMDLYGSKYPAAWDDVVADYPNAFLNGVDIKYGPFRGHHYPIKAYLLRTGNSVITGTTPPHWIKGLTEKDSSGNYKVELIVFIDSLIPGERPLCRRHPSRGQLHGENEPYRISIPPTRSSTTGTK